MRVIVTGGAGFIGSELIRQLIAETDWEVYNLDKLTYAGNLDSLASVEKDPRYHFIQADIVNPKAVEDVYQSVKPDAVMHLAAESHVDRSIDGPAEFIQTNIVGTYNLLESGRKYWSELSAKAKEDFRFLHISTDEVFGSLGDTGFFTETTPYDPRSPYSSSKASSDHLVCAWFHTYGFPVLITNCSNNYGPYQFPEKLVPLITINALNLKKLPVYGKGENIRDWLYVEDHARALRLVLEKGQLGRTYCVGGHNEKQNIDVVKIICNILDELVPSEQVSERTSLIEYVTDRPGHDMRYAIDPSRIGDELGWKPRESFETGFRKTVEWYLNNKEWWERVHSGEYQGERLGLGG